MPEWTDVAAMNYASPALREYMIAMLKYWIRNVRRGRIPLRFASMVPTDFWEQARAELDQASSRTS